MASHSRRTVRLIALLLLFAPVHVRSETASAAERSVPTEEIREIFAEYDRTDSPGCAVGVVKDGELIHARGYGMANLEHRIALGPESVFRIGSTSKQFTAAVMLLLDRDGVLDLDADVRTYLPELAAYEEPVTVRQTIHHTSGYRDYLTLAWLGGLRDDDWYTDPEVVDLLARQKELNFPPGTEHLYSNSGYFLLSQVVRAATGKTLREVAAERIFQPLGMESTHFHDDHREIVPERAVGYAPREEGGYRISMTTLDMVGDGGVFTTVEDLAKWDRAFYDDRLGDGFAEAMTETAVLPDGEDTEYAFGLAVTDYHGLRKVHHGGAFVGYRANLIRFPERRLSVICLCNRADANPGRLAQRVADLWLADVLPAPTGSGEAKAGDGEIDLAREALEAYTGGYRESGEDDVVRLELKDGRLTFRTSGSEHALRPVREDAFRLDIPWADGRIVFLPGEGSRRPFDLVVGENEPRRFEPVELWTPAPGDWERYEGTWTCEELRTELVVSREEPGLRVRHANRFREQPEDVLEPTLPRRFEGGGLTITFDESGDTRARSLRVGAGRVQNLLCTRNESE